ncbi:ulp1 protease family, C-terminal catalytic domain-containing protein [Tanacetum coccineum]
MAKLPNRPQKIQALANRFINRKDRNEQIIVASPDGMYEKTFYESVEYESLLGWMMNDWLDATILHWWCMHLFEMVSKEEFNTYAIFNPTIIQGAFDNSFKWTMLECNQQVAFWECGYYVMKFVFETLYIKQKTFPDQLHDSTRALRKDELDGLIINAGSKFFQEYCNDD